MGKGSGENRYLASWQVGCRFRVPAWDESHRDDEPIVPFSAQKQPEKVNGDDRQKCSADGTRYIEDRLSAVHECFASLVAPRLGLAGADTCGNHICNYPVIAGSLAQKLLSFQALRPSNQ
jgi:hypothetical protein